MLHERVDGALGRGIGRQLADSRARCQRRCHHDTGAFAHQGQQLLHQEERCADVDSEHAVEVFDGLRLDAGGYRNAGVGDKNVELAANELADFRREFVRAIGRQQVGADSIGLAAGFAYFGDQRIGILGGIAIVNDDAGAGMGQCAGGGAADATGGAGDEGGSADEVGHDQSPVVDGCWDEFTRRSCRR